MTESIKLVAFSKEQPARLLVHYLQQQGIDVEYRYSDTDYAHEVNVNNGLQEAKAKEIVQEFLLDPNNEKYQSVAWQSGNTVSLTPVKSLSMARALRSVKSSPFCGLILVVCALIFIIANLGITAPYRWLHIQPLGYLFEHGQYWRIIGPALLHFSALHIAFNLMWWWALGKQIEEKLGMSSLVILFLFSATVSNLGQLLVSGPNFGGLSGVVYALVGAVWWFGWLKPHWQIGLPKPIIGFMLVWLLVGFIDILPISMANTAHTLGLVSGCVFALIVSRFDKEKPIT